MNIREICETFILQKFLLNVNSKGVYFIWVGLESKNTQLKQVL